MSRYQKGKTDLDFIEAVSGSGISWAICKSVPRSRQPCQHPTTQRVKALKAKLLHYYNTYSGCTTATLRLADDFSACAGGGSSGGGTDFISGVLSWYWFDSHQPMGNTSCESTAQ